MEDGNYASTGPKDRGDYTSAGSQDGSYALSGSEAGGNDHSRNEAEGYDDSHNEAREYERSPKLEADFEKSPELEADDEKSPKQAEDMMMKMLHGLDIYFYTKSHYQQCYVQYKSQRNSNMNIYNLKSSKIKQ